jgi:hypothetical protein
LLLYVIFAARVSLNLRCDLADVGALKDVGNKLQLSIMVILKIAVTALERKIVLLEDIKHINNKT